MLITHLHPATRLRIGRTIPLFRGLGQLQVGRIRDRFQAVTLGIYSVAADISVCPWVDSASKNEYQDILGGKGGRCVRVTTVQPSCAECLVIWSLNRPEPSGPHRPVIGVALPLPYLYSRSVPGWHVTREPLPL